MCSKDHAQISEVLWNHSFRKTRSTSLDILKSCDYGLLKCTCLELPGVSCFYIESLFMSSWTARVNNNTPKIVNASSSHEELFIANVFKTNALKWLCCWSMLYIISEHIQPVWRGLQHQVCKNTYVLLSFPCKRPGYVDRTTASQLI